MSLDAKPRPPSHRTGVPVLPPVRDAVVAFTERRGLAAWRVLLEGRHVESGYAFVSGGEADRIRLALLEWLLRAATAGGCRVAVRSNDPATRRAVSRSEGSCPGSPVVGPGPFADRDDVRCLAEEALWSAPEEVIATDGSYHRAGDRAGWAWVSSRGVYGFGSARPAGALTAELHAIARGLSALPDVSVVAREHHRRPTVLVDSRPTLSVVDAIREHGSARGRVHDRDLSRSLERAVRDKPARLGWVRGHSGHRLNEAADRLARHARRGGRDDAARVLVADALDLPSPTHVRRA